MGAGVAGAALLAACGSDEPPAPGTPGPTSVQAPFRLRTRTVMSGEPSGLLRLGVVDANDFMRRFARDEQLLTYSRLVGLDPRAATVHGDLAEAIELPEPLVVRVELKRDRHFHPGRGGTPQPVTAEAVQRDFERRRDEGVYLFSDVIEMVEAPSAEDVVLHLRAPFALLFEMLASASASIRGSDEYDGIPEPTGSGPFTPASRSPWGYGFASSPLWPEGTGLQEIEVVRAEGERDLDALFANRRIDVREHPESTSRSGAESLRDARAVTRASQRMRGLGLSLIGQKDGLSVRHIPAFQDQRVRRAVSLSLNREALRELDGSAPSGPVGPAHGGDALPPVELQTHALYRHQPAEARALLQGAEQEGLTFRILHTDAPAMLALAQRVSEQLREGGFEPRLMSATTEQWEAAFVRGDFESTLFELSVLETPDLGLRLHTSGGLTGRFSLWGYSNPVYDAAVRETLSRINPTARSRRAREAQRRLLEDVPAMFPIGAPLDHATLTPGLRGYEFDAYGFNTGYLAARWRMEDGVEGDGVAPDEEGDDANA